MTTATRYRFDLEDAAATVWWSWAEWSAQGPICPLFGPGFDADTRLLLLAPPPGPAGPWRRCSDASAAPNGLARGLPNIE